MPDELQRKSKEDSSTGWSDSLSGDPVGLSDAQFEFIQSRAKTKPSAPDDPTPWSRWSVGLSDGQLEANSGDLSASDHPTVPFSVDVSQQLVWCLGLFIPPPLTHLRWMDCVEVQRSSRHIQDHIQSIQVLNCSSLDLHILCVCA
jgi:hypothetical protein